MLKCHCYFGDFDNCECEWWCVYVAMQYVNACKHRCVCVYLFFTSAESSVSGVCGPSLS